MRSLYGFFVAVAIVSVGWSRPAHADCMANFLGQRNVFLSSYFASCGASQVSPVATIIAGDEVFTEADQQTLRQVVALALSFDLTR